MKDRALQSSLPPVQSDRPPRPRRNIRLESREADLLGGIASPVLRAAAKRVAAFLLVETGDPDGEEGLAVLAALATAIEAGPVRAPALSVLGSRLLDLLRAEVVGGWPEHRDAAAEMRALLSAIERVRGTIALHWNESFASRLASPDAPHLVAEVAHDLRSPLTSILFLAESLQRGQCGAVNGVQRRQLGLIYAAAFGLCALAGDLVELTRDGDSLMEQEPVRFSVTELFESICNIVRPIAEEKQLTVGCQPPDVDTFRGHPLALSRVLLNLTTNALKFTDQGFVEIRAVHLPGDGVEFSVCDSGKGIDPAMLDRLCEPFRPVAEGRAYRFSGTGIGLTMCRKLVEAMGGRLQVEARPQHGSRFFFTLHLPAAPV